MENPLNNGVEEIRREMETEKDHSFPLAKTSQHSLIRHAKRVVVFFLIFLAAILANVLIIFFYFGPSVAPSVFILSEIRMNGPTDLCPGDTLDFEFDVTVKEEGTYNLFMSTWKVDPPPSTIIFSELQPFVIGSQRSFSIPREWKIPVVYEDPANNVRVPMLPGAYIRDISVTAEGRNTKNKPLQVFFNIKKDCPSLEKEENEQ